MKIGIDARMLGGANGGIGRYIEQFIAAVLEIDRENQYVLFLKHTKYENYPAIGRDPAQGGGEITKPNVKKILANIPWYSWQEQIKFPHIIMREKIDLMHFPHWNVPLFYHGPFVVTIHDLIMYHYPRMEASTHGRVAYWLKDAAHRFVLKAAVARATHIFATSEFTKADVHEELKAPNQKMTVTYQAPFGANSKILNPNSKLLFERWGITKPYVLYVGSAYPHKNLDRLLQAWKLLEDRIEGGCQLVLVGKDGYFYSRLKTSKLMNQLTNKPIFTGAVSDDELASLYVGARLYVFPSLYEGFGLPPLEAMQHNLPVASSNRTCLPEVLGEAALYFDPENIAQMADVIERGLTDETVRMDLRARAREELRRYSWEHLARQTLAIYQAVVTAKIR